MTQRYETRLPVSDVFLNVVEQGEGPTLLLLHGFPEFAWSWEPIMATLAEDFFVVAPDQRGYGKSEKPDGVNAYRMDELVNDMLGLIDFLDRGPVMLVGHDWGATVAWTLAQRHPRLIKGLMVINGPHPAVFTRELRDNPAQRAAAAYIDMLISPQAEALLKTGNFSGLIEAFGKTLSADEQSRYRDTYQETGTLTGMLNWYRAHFQPGPTPFGGWLDTGPVSVPTRIVWGMSDERLLPGNLSGLEAHATDLSIVRIPEGGHWLLHEMPDRIAHEIKDWAEGLA